MKEKANEILNLFFQNEKKGTSLEKIIYKTIILPILSIPDVLSLLKYKHHKFTNLLNHSLNVSYYCFLTSFRKGLDYKSSAIGGLLHDFCLIPMNEYKEKGIKNLWCFFHPKEAVKEAKKHIDLSETSIDIIQKHMFPLASIPKHKETFIIVLWDKYFAILEVFNKKNNIKENKIYLT